MAYAEFHHFRRGLLCGLGVLLVAINRIKCINKKQDKILFN